MLTPRCRAPAIPRNARLPPSSLPSTRSASSGTTMISTTRICMPKSRARGRPRNKRVETGFALTHSGRLYLPHKRAQFSFLPPPNHEKAPAISDDQSGMSFSLSRKNNSSHFCRAWRQKDSISRDVFFFRILSHTHILIPARSRRSRIEATQPTSDCFGYPRRATVCSSPRARSRVG